MSICTPCTNSKLKPCVDEQSAIPKGSNTTKAKAKQTCSATSQKKRKCLVHPNMLLREIMEIRKDYAKIVAPQRSIKIICLHFEECDTIIAKKFRSQLLVSKLTILVSSICSVCK